MAAAIMGLGAWLISKTSDVDSPAKEILQILVIIVGIAIVVITGIGQNMSQE